MKRIILLYKNIYFAAPTVIALQITDFTISFQTHSDLETASKRKRLLSDAVR